MTTHPLSSRLRELMEKATPGPISLFKQPLDCVVDHDYSIFTADGEIVLALLNLSSGTRDDLHLLVELRNNATAYADAIDALAKIAECDHPRPVGTRWFPDGTPSKHDKCTHGVWMYADCDNCVAEFAAEVLARISLKGKP